MKIQVLRVKDWNTLYENNRTRELKSLDWFPMRNKHDGDGFTELLDHPNGVAHYGAWVLLLQVASKGSTSAPRGTLLRECARPHDAKSLARMTRGNETIFSEAIPRLLDMKWLETVEFTIEESAAKPEGVGTIPHDPAPSCDKLPSSRARACASVQFSSVPSGEGVGGVENPIVNLKTWLSTVFRKTPGVIWPNNEEHLIVEIARRPALPDELAELEAYRVANLRYFPRSSARLLDQWDKTLDEARNWKELHQDENPPTLTADEKLRLALQ